MKELFTKFLSSGLSILLVISLLYIIFLRECKKPEPCPAEGEILVPLTVWNKIQELANKPAEVHIDTVWKERPVVEPDPQPPLPDPQTTIDTTIVIYQDSLINKEINVWVDYTIKGLLLDRKWRYKPISSTIRIDSIIYVPRIVEIEKLVKMPQNGLYPYITWGGNITGIAVGGGLDWITVHNTIIGYQYQRFDNLNIHSVKFGMKLVFKK
jgi:hypothetical protein